MSQYRPLLHWRYQNPRLAKANLQIHKNFNFDNFLILDFESTCQKDKKTAKQEIIEFPCILTDSSFNMLSVFHRYVKPIHNPVLTHFCTELTGITQTMVENEETFDRILPSFLKWLQNTENDFGRNMKKTFIICGDWDLRIMLPDQCQMSNISVPPVMTQWLNLKKVFLDTTNYYPKSLKDMCRYLGISSSGREHSGIGDCRTILNVMKTLKMKYAL